MASAKLFSLESKSLKVDTAEDIEPHIKELRDNVEVEEVRFQGNTLGIGASEALAEVLKTKKSLQVRCLLLLGATCLLVGILAHHDICSTDCQSRRHIHFAPTV